MGALSRSMLMKVHAFLAAFILPVAIMFFVTGAFYTWGIKGSYDTSVHELNLQKPMEKNLTELIVLVKNEIKKRNIETPTGKAKIKTIGDSFKLEWTGSNVDIILESTSQPLVMKLKIKNTSWYRKFVQLHKAKGGYFFKIYAAILATALLLLLVTGFIMAWQTPKLRNLSLVSVVLGMATFFTMVFIS